MLIYLDPVNFQCKGGKKKTLFIVTTWGWVNNDRILNIWLDYDFDEPVHCTRTLKRDPYWCQLTVYNIEAIKNIYEYSDHFLLHKPTT